MSVNKFAYRAWHNGEQNTGAAEVMQLHKATIRETCHEMQSWSVLWEFDYHDIILIACWTASPYISAIVLGGQSTQHGSMPTSVFV